MTKDDHSAPLSDVQLRVKALESVLTEKGYIQADTLDTIIDHYENRVGPHVGARVVAKAWTDPAFKSRLLENAGDAIAEMGIGGFSAAHLLVKENTDSVHNLVVCTLCSCYPWALLGLPPVWYKSTPYRARAVRDPRGLLEEMGISLDAQTRVHVWDSNAELRYLVLPQQPASTTDLSEEQLAALVTRDSMVGTARIHPPE